MGLKAQDRVKDEKARKRKEKHGRGIGSPALLLSGINAGKAIEIALDAAEYRRKKGALA